MQSETSSLFRSTRLNVYTLQTTRLSIRQQVPQSSVQRSRLRSIGRPQQKGKMSGGHPPLPKAVNCGSKRPLERSH